MEHQRKLILELKNEALDIRKRVIEMAAAARMGHIGSDLSSIDILTVLYFHILKIDPQRPGWYDRDRFVLSKGHGCRALYTTLVKASFCSGIIIFTTKEYLPPGVHEDQEGFVVLEGRGWAKVGDEEYRLEPEVCFIAPAGVKHSIKRDPGSEHLKVHWFHGAI